MEIVAIPCPECGHQLQLRDRSLLGQAARCPECNHKFFLEEQAAPRRADDSLSARETIAPGALAESLAEPAEHCEPILKEFGRYKLLRELGQGAMGTVYLARDAQLDRQVALKIPKFRDDDSTILERFYREARSAATLRHPNICPVFDVGEVDGTHYLTMAYIEGRTLSNEINRQTPQSERQVVGIVRKLASALDHAHKEGVVHRDLKPANIMIDVRSDPIVMDFGLALQLETGNDRLTQTGMILGTPAYMSPEQVRTEWDQVGPPSDVYSLGIILFELLTGEVPFDGPVGVVMALVLTQEPPKPSEFRPDLDPQLEAICLKMMAKEIDSRYTSMREVDTALARFLKNSKQRTPKPQPVEPIFPTAPPPTAKRKSKSQPRETSAPPRRTVPNRGRNVKQRTPVNLRSTGKNKRKQSHGINLYDRLKSPIGIVWAGVGVLCMFAAVFLLREALGLSGPPEKLPASSAMEGMADSGSSRSRPAKLTPDAAAVKNHMTPDQLELGDPVVNSIGMLLVPIPAGEFRMGSPDSDNDAADDEKPQHLVKITKPFLLSVYEITQQQYAKVMNRLQK